MVFKKNKKPFAFLLFVFPFCKTIGSSNLFILTLVLPKGVVTTPSRIFPVALLRSFDEKNLVYRGGGLGKPSKMSGTGGGCHLKKKNKGAILIGFHIYGLETYCVLEIAFPSLISQKPGKILIFRNFSGKFSILAYISLENRDETHVYTTCIVPITCI